VICVPQLIAKSEVVLAVDLDKIDSLKQLLDQIPNLGFFDKLFGKKSSIYEKAVFLCLLDTSSEAFGKLDQVRKSLRLPDDATKQCKQRGWLSYCQHEIQKSIPGEALIVHVRELAERLHLESAEIKKGLTYELYWSLLTQEFCNKSMVDEYKRLFDLTDDALPEDIVRIVKSKEKIVQIRNGCLGSIQAPINLIRNESFHLELVDVVCEYPGPGDSYKYFNGNLYISNLRVVFDNMKRVIPLRFSEILNFHVELYRHNFGADGGQKILPIENDIQDIGELVEKNKLVIAKKGLRKKVALNAINIECAYELLSKLMPGVGKAEFFTVRKGFMSVYSHHPLK